jgi:hypothetical protein
MRWVEHGMKRNAYRILVGKPRRRKHLGRSRRRRKDNVKTDIVVLAGLIWLTIGTRGGLL